MSTASSFVSPSPPTVAAPRSVRVVIEENIVIPAEVVDLDSFCRWAISDQFPERGRFSYLGGAIWVDLSREDLYRHNQVKGAFSTALDGLVKSLTLGRFIPDGMLLRNSEVDLSTEPDGMFVSYDALRSGRVQRLEGRTPDVCAQASGRMAEIDGFRPFLPIDANNRSARRSALYSECADVRVRTADAPRQTGLQAGRTLANLIVCLAEADSPSLGFALADSSAPSRSREGRGNHGTTHSQS